MNTTSIEALVAKGDFVCECGKLHSAKVKDVVISSGAINRVPEFIAKYGCKKVFLLADDNTFKAAGEKLLKILDNSEISYKTFVMNEARTEPDEHAVGSVALHIDAASDMLISVGSGVINDIGKIIANMLSVPYMIVGTAPSMDGYASGTSSVIRDNLKVSVDSRCPDIVIGDTDILKEAPIRMVQSGIGDMLAKYISIAEWKISKIINGEYYCPMVANLIVSALDKCVSNAGGILKRDARAVEAVMEGMVLSGIAANYAGVSRPVSGMEHYFSHVWDMRMIEFGTPADFHGIQCGIGTVGCLRVYEEIKKLTPNREKALEYVSRFDYGEWTKFLVENLGKSAAPMLANEVKEQKYNKENHARRLEVIIEKWDEILEVINTLPSSDEIINLLKGIGAPCRAEEISISREEERNAFLMTKDIRDKYIGSRLLWDIGELENVADKVFPIKK